MIIAEKDDVVALSGALRKNEWSKLHATAIMLLDKHPEGIIVDCAGLTDITEDGAKTFLDAIRYIEAASARIVVACLPEQVLSVFRSVPGVRSQLPIADSVAEARASLRMATLSAAPAGTNGARRGTILLTPLIADLDLTYGAYLAGRLARDGRGEVHLVYFLEVARTLPLNAPMLEEEQKAQEALAQATQYTKQLNVAAVAHIERVREATDGILTALKTYHADVVVIGAACEPVGVEGHDTFHQLADIMLRRAPCEVIIGRLKQNE